MAAKRTKRTPKKRTAPDWGPKFLATLRAEGNIREACERSHVGRTTVYERRDSDPAFAVAMRESLNDAVDSLEGEARRRAMESSDTLMIFLLKAHRPNVYRENVKHEHSGPAGGKIPVSVTHDIAADLAPYLGIIAGLGRDLAGASREALARDGAEQPVHPPAPDAPAGPAPSHPGS